MATGTKTMQAKANHGIPRMARERAGEREGEHRHVEDGQAPATPDHERDRDRERGRRTRRVRGGRGPAPLGHLSRERRIDEEEVVVADGRRPGRTG